MLGALLLPLLLVAVLLLYARPSPADAQSGVTNFDTVVLAGDLIVGDDATVAGDLTLTGDTTLTELTVSDFVNITAQDAISLTMNATLTPTGSLQPLESAGAVSIDGGAEIVHTTDYLILVNIGAQTITISETTGLISAGNIALGAGDSATLVWADGGWYQVAASNN
jgi:hypothetical protein